MRGVLITQIAQAVDDSGIRVIQVGVFDEEDLPQVAFKLGISRNQLNDIATKIDRQLDSSFGANQSRPVLKYSCRDTSNGQATGASGSFCIGVDNKSIIAAGVQIAIFLSNGQGSGVVDTN